MIISEFKGEYRWLSNFATAQVEYDGHIFPTVEHAYVYSKTLIRDEQELLLAEKDELSPGQMKRLGKSLTLRPDWESVRLDIMKNLIIQKFNIPIYKKKLQDTGNAELIESNTWNDTFWGVCKGVGENHLGKIIMEVRSQLRD